MDVVDVIADLAAEQHSLDDVVVRLTPEQWDAPTASPRWTVTDQLAHLTYFDRTAALAITDPDGFADHARELASMLSGDAEPEEGDELTLGEFRRLEPAERLMAWQEGRAELLAAASTLENDTRVPWYGPSMGAKSFLTARLMECWAHGIDVRDAVGARHHPSDRLRHIAQLGFITRAWTYRNRGLDDPTEPVRVALAAPSGDTWTWGPDDAVESVEGPAEDFCLVVTQRRHVDDTALVLTGDAARDWMTKAQAFAGPATDGPTPTEA